VSARVVSCGVVLLDPHGRVLLAHATETSHWDIPKGHGEEGEAPLVTALREMVEETGIVIAAERLKDLGLFVYRRDKDLHLFAARAHDDELDLDAYRWAEPEEVERYASRSLTRLFQTTLSLAELHRSL